MDYIDRYKFWLKNVKDKDLKNELKNMTDEEIKTAFFKDIEFGTGGMRGVLGSGANCMNKYNVAKVTKALCEYLKCKKKASVAISYDSRNMSYEFAGLVAKICAKNGVKVYLAQTMMPTPFLSYMVRFYGCDMGVMITASHNPKEYNGYKVYDENGCQLLDEPSLKLMELANSINPFEIEEMDFSEAVSSGKIKFTDNKILKSYINEVMKQSLINIENLKVVYTALHGTGIKTIPIVLEKNGAGVILNAIQCEADKNFTTCPYPNPENENVYSSSNELAFKENADLVIASDPDADRVGVNVIKNGRAYHLTGNEVGVLLSDFLLTHKKYKNGVLVKSIVSTSLVDKIAKKHGVKVCNVLTGFKYIGEQIAKLENDESQEFVFGFEESLGYLVGTYVRDKDATVASMMVCEMTSFYKKQGKTLLDRLNEIYEEFGFYEHYVTRYDFSGEEGFVKMHSILNSVRKNPPKKFGKFKVEKFTDYETGVDDLPKSDVMEFCLENDAKIIIRPSGTEPLIKVYVTLSKTKSENDKCVKVINDEIVSLLK